MKQIPVHLLRDRTSVGLQMKHFKKEDVLPEDAEVIGIHRDDHYMFFILESGSGSMMIDFNEMLLPERSLYYVLPSQVHQRIRNQAAEGWYIAVDTSLVPPECRTVFEGNLRLQDPCPLDDIQLKQSHDLLTLLFEKYREDDTDPFYVMVIHALLRSFLALAASCYNGDVDLKFKFSRPAQLTAQFKDLLTTEMRSIKSPAGYAARLNVSEAYLSEVLKKMTGAPASYWIQQEVIVEAKRLLYHSQLTVKEIAHQLGYADHSYFSRLFRKVTGTAAIAFRDQNRK